MRDSYKGAPADVREWMDGSDTSYRVLRDGSRYTIETNMLNVNVVELKNDLTSILQEVMAGEEILILDQERPVAKLVPVKLEENFDSQLLALAAAGKARLPEMDLPESFWEMPAPEIPLDKIITTLRSDRDEE